jgi:hypothetical protein
MEGVNKICLVRNFFQKVDTIVPFSIDVTSQSTGA